MAVLQTEHSDAGRPLRNRKRRTPAQRLSFHTTSTSENIPAQAIVARPRRKLKMKKKLLLCLAVMAMMGISTVAQEAKMQPLTFWYEYTVNPGKEAQFVELVKTVGAPVRDKL